MNKFLNGLTDATNFTLTENGAVTHKTTRSDLMDMFAMGAAMRNRPLEDITNMFAKAYKENPVYALKCLFYIRDIRGGQGERRFFRTIIKYLASNDKETMQRNLKYIPEFGRWDDLYELVDTPLEQEMFDFIKHQLALDVKCKTPSLLAKWLKSENTSSAKSRWLGNKTRIALGMNHKQYRKTLSILRARINVLERLMSERRWDEIEFDKIPSRAGMIYRNAFARHDLERAASKKNIQTYEEFAADTTKTMNAKALYPYECVHAAFYAYNETQKNIAQKSWDNLTDYFNGAVFNGLAMVDVSGSMEGIPMEVAVSLGMYCAEKAKGPFADHFMTFAGNPELIRVQGSNICEKVHNMCNANWGGNTNIEAAFDLMLKTALENHCSQEDIPQNLIIVSDMEFDECVSYGPISTSRWSYNYEYVVDQGNVSTLLEDISQRWSEAGYKMPHLIFWNVDARQDNIPMKDNGGVSYVSGFSPSIFESIMTGKTGYDLMMDKLNSERYSMIH